MTLIKYEMVAFRNASDERGDGGEESGHGAKVAHGVEKRSIIWRDQSREECCMILSEAGTRKICRYVENGRRKSEGERVVDQGWVDWVSELWLAGVAYRKRKRG